ncbi:MAG: PilZ domain-containing protein, partial [Fimbriimonadales bacterium]|nr:PilZ domain-containing protein [Fimbriimonadales bacterium]
MTASVQIQIPNTERMIEGVLVGLEKQAMRLTVRVESGGEFLRPNMLAHVMLMVGGAPRRLTMQVQPLNETTFSLVPVSAAQCCDRRKRKRYTMNIGTEIRLGDNCVAARVVNLSITGLGLQVPQAMEVGQEFEVSLPLVGLEQVLQARAQVRHCRELSNGLWYIGAAFVNLSRADELWLRKLFP